jgi:uncharacterized protein
MLAMLLQIRITLFCLIFLLLLSVNSFSKNIDGIINFGDSLFEQQQYEAALNEYQRAFFFSLPCDKQTLSKKIAGCYIVTTEFEQALEFLDTAFYYSENDSEKVEYTFNKIQCYLLQREYGYALLKLDQVETGSNYYFNSKKELLKGISFFGIDQYDKAFQSFNKVFDTTDSVNILQLSNLFKDINKIKKPNPAIATIMSILLPGSGQFYTGNILPGINSVVLLTGLTCISLYLPALTIIIVPFLYRYYCGGILHANQYASVKRQLKKYKFYSNLLELFPEAEFSRSLFTLPVKRNHYHDLLNSSDSEMKIIFSILFLTYKQFFSSQDVGACIFHPSCSEYMMEEIKKQGVFLGFLDGLDRLLRCHSFVSENDYQYDMIIEKYDDEP